MYTTLENLKKKRKEKVLKPRTRIKETKPTHQHRMERL